MLAAAATLLAGCGSGKPSKAQYVAKVNKECAALNAVLTAIGRKAANFQEGLEESVKAKEHASERLHAIELPADDAVLRRWLHYRDLALTAGREAVDARPSSARRRTRGAQYSAATNKAERIARSYGLTSCVLGAAS